MQTRSMKRKIADVVTEQPKHKNSVSNDYGSTVPITLSLLLPYVKAAFDSGSFEERVYENEVYTGDNNDEPMPINLMQQFLRKVDGKFFLYQDVNKDLIYNCMRGIESVETIKNVAKGMMEFRDMHTRDLYMILEDEAPELADMYPLIRFRHVGELLMQSAEKKEKK